MTERSTERAKPTDAVREFLLLRWAYEQRYRWTSHKWIGRSADAMVWAAAFGDPPRDQPFDGWDLGRCLVTRALAPPELHEAMDALLVRWRDQLVKRERSWAGTYIGDAEQMARDHTEEVRAEVEILRGIVL